MNTFFEYLRIEFKKSIKVFQKSLVSILLVLFVLTIGVASISYTLLQNQVFQLVKVAVVIPDSEEQSKLVLQFLSSMDSVKSICEFEYVEEETAFEMLEDGEAQAIILLPENFYEDIYYGENTPAMIYFPKEKDVNQRLFEKLLTSGMALLQISEAGVYSTQYLAYEQQLEVNRGELGEYIALKYAKTVLNRSAIYEAQVLSPLGGVDVVQYYFTALMLLVMLFSGILFGFLYRKENKAVEQKLKIYGMNALSLSVIKIGIMVFYLWMIEWLFMIGGKLLSENKAFTVLDFFGMDFLKSGFFGGLLALVIASYFHMVYSVGKDYQQGTIFLLLSNVILFLSSGLIVPKAYLPVGVQKLSVLSPLTLLSRFQLDYLFGQLSLWIVGVTILLFMIFVAVGVFFSWKKV